MVVVMLVEVMILVEDIWGSNGGVGDGDSDGGWGSKGGNDYF